MQVITRKVMNSPSWSIQGGEKKNPEAVEITRKIQELLKPGDGRPGIAYNFIDAQVRFTLRSQQICKQPYFSVDSVHDLSLVYVCLCVSLGTYLMNLSLSKIFPFLLGPQSCVASVRVISNFLCHTQLCSANVQSQSQCIKSRLRQWRQDCLQRLGELSSQEELK